jgi:MoaA/NifB/PqqE/SkfB family radical SAM enzyme
MSYINSKQKIFFHVDRINEIRATGNTVAPVNVEIDLSNRCSHGCSWCHFAYTHTRGPLAGKRDKPEDAIAGGDLMDLDLAHEILMHLSASGVKSVTWTGGGEPTLHPYFDEIIETATHWGLEQGLYTHGGHISAERAALLKQTLTFVYVSLDECDEVKFKTSKGVDRYWKVLEGIDNLVAAKGGATIGIGFLLHVGNVDDVDEMVALGLRHGVDYVQFRPIIAYDQVAPNQLVEDTQWVNRAINNLRRYAGDKFVQSDAWRFEMYRDWRGHGYPTCHWSALQTVITPNGKVWRCTNKREHPEALLGDLTITNFADIWARVGGSCAVDDKCRVMCRGHIANLTLDSIMTEPVHANFI